ncbi:VOC family protein [Salmonella enterica subsp. enterica]|nr:VOC family protein [Salmonella enterica subsp. enterica]EEJ8889533.1 VOC family protein [Salmonella enterica subsp. enterica serovar Bovismorbificans]
MISHLDHLVLTTANEEASTLFYVSILGMRLQTFRGGRKAFVFGNQKINLHIQGKEFEPKALKPTPGSLDLCFITSRPLEECINIFRKNNIRIAEGPVNRTGAQGTIRSIYVRDPDQNLIEISEYLD